MSYTKPFNIIISGVGGQGVLSLTKIIWKLCEKHRLKCQGSVFKGGAQRLGSIHSVLRLFLTECPDYSSYSTQIPNHELDMLIGLEPWETLRYQNYFNLKTKIFMNTQVYPLLMERYKKYKIENPVKEVMALGLPLVTDDYTAKAVSIFKTKKMANYLIGLDSLISKSFPFSFKDYVTAFIELVSLDPWPLKLLRQNLDEIN